MGHQDWDEYFAHAYPNPLSADGSRLRTQLLDSDRPPFGPAANLKITDIAGGVPHTHAVKGATATAGLERILDGTLSPKGIRIISLASSRKTSPLEITTPLAAKIFVKYSIKPEFLRVLLFFGRAPLESEARNSFISFHDGDDGEFTLSYRLHYFEKNRSGAWVSRQIGVYHHRYGKEAGSGSLVILAAGTRQTRFLSMLEEQLSLSAAGASNPAALHLEASPWSFHTSLLSCYVDGWRDYFHHLGTNFSAIGDRALGTTGLVVNDETIRDVKTLRHLYDLSLFGGAACAGNVDIARALATRLEGLPRAEARSLEASADMLEGLASSCGVLQKKIKNATDLVGYLIAFHYQVVTAKLESEVRDVTSRMVSLTEENRDLTRQLRELAEGTSEMTRRLKDLTQNTASDGAVVSVITVVSAVYLPGSFVGTVFGMNFFNFDQQARRIAISSDFWIFVVLWVGLMIVTAGIFAGVYRMKRSGITWPRKRLGDAASGGGGGEVKVGVTV